MARSPMLRLSAAVAAAVVATLLPSPAAATWWNCQHVGRLTLCVSSDGTYYLTCQRGGGLTFCHRGGVPPPGRRRGRQ